MINKCDAILVLSGDHTKDVITCRCALPKGHSGPHHECGDMGIEEAPIPYTIEWYGSSLPVE